MKQHQDSLQMHQRHGRPALGALLALALGLHAAGAALAQSAAEAPITPQTYIACQIAARQATITGMEERLALVNRGAAAVERRSAGEMSRNRVTLAFHGCGYGASALAAYAHSHAAEVATFLAQNPSHQARLEATATRVTNLSAQMPAVSPSAKR
jgi:hypothetical protein